MASPQRRFAARRAVLLDGSLSVNARFLYVLMDDMCGPNGTCFPSYETMMRVSGLSRRALSYELTALKGASVLKTQKRQHTSALFTLAWADSEVHPIALLEPQKCTPVHFSSAEFCTSEPSPPLCVNHVILTNVRATVRCACGSYLEEEPEAAVRCGPCSHVHYPGCARCSAVEPVAEAVALLASYVERCGLSWAPPDVDIAGRALAAAGGMVGLFSGLRFLLLERRAKPGRSYAWFPVVLAGLRSGRKAS